MDQSDDVVTDEAHVSKRPNPIAVCADRDDVGRVSCTPWIRVRHRRWKVELPGARAATHRRCLDPTARARWAHYAYPPFGVGGQLNNSGGRCRRRRSHPRRGRFACGRGAGRWPLRCLAPTRNQNKHGRDQTRDGDRGENPRISPLCLTSGFAAPARDPSDHWSSMPTHSPVPPRSPGRRRPILSMPTRKTIFTLRRRAPHNRPGPRGPSMSSGVSRKFCCQSGQLQGAPRQLGRLQGRFPQTTEEPTLPVQPAHYGPDACSVYLDGTAISGPRTVEMNADSAAPKGQSARPRTAG